jgi:predicted enzyme related to lactoylglutathione lyase
MPRVIHFEISADDTERAVDFYREVFGWEFQKFGGPRDYWLVTTGEEGEPGINGGVFRRDGPVNFVNTVKVASVDESAAKVVERGGKVVVPKANIPGVGNLVYCQDTEQNVFGMLEDESKDETSTQ